MAERFVNHRRLEHLERRRSLAAVARLRDALSAASDLEIARVVDAHRRGERDESARLFEELGVTKTLFEMAVGVNWAAEPPASVDRRLGEIFIDVLGEPRRSSIKAHLRMLRKRDERSDT